jgi:hypothetical protein
MYTSWPGARRWLLVDPALRTQRSTLDWSPERKEHERLRQREFRRLRRLEDDRRMAVLTGRSGRYTKLERAGHVTQDREEEWLAMAERNSRILYEQALLRSANPTHALMGDPPPRDRRSTSAPVIIRAASTLRTD